MNVMERYIMKQIESSTRFTLLYGDIESYQMTITEMENKTLKLQSRKR